MDHRTLLDPTGEHEAVAKKLAARPRSLDGVTVGILDIGKARGDVYLNQLALRLGERGIAVKRYAKPTPSRLASGETRARMKSEVQAAIIGLAD
ncbi:MAG TPA: hypothetical protein PK264_05800 [Hyphomicrobiaceae bacterium]|nr:hypothetical protein [Hyphomicrobiaceae bacterium]